MTTDVTRTTCPYCGVGCGVLARPAPDGQSAEISGDPEHPANFGRLCSKGSALGETLSHDDRLLFPRIGERRATWTEALDLVAERFGQTIASHGPDSVALYVSGQLLSEDYYVANKLMKGYIGSANIDTNSRLCMASSVAGHKRAFGADTVPGTYRDFEDADLVVLVGSNLAWCHPVLYQRLMTAREQRGTRIVVIDPRQTATCEGADLHLPLNPGSDVALFNGLLAHLIADGRTDVAYVGAHTAGLGEAMKVAESSSLDVVAHATGLAAETIAQFYALFARTERVVTAYSQGVNQSSAGTDKVNAIINCHLVTGRIGRPGMGPFSVTGQPNAMGGRETGGLANMLAAHMDLADAGHRRIVQGFWNSPAIASTPGLKAVDMFRAVADGRIKAIWIISTNPVASLPEADTVRAGLKACPFVVVSDVTAQTDTARCAHVLLPASAWGEKDGTVTNSERRISRQRAFLTAPAEARPDWWQIAEVAKRMGFGSAFDYGGPADIFAEYAALTGAENSGSRDLDISAHAAITAQAYRDLAPFQWPQPAGQPQSESRFFANGGFYTPDRRARFVATPFRSPQQHVSARYPLILNTGRIRDQWHTMTRTGKSARLMSHIAEPFIELHPDDATRLGLSSADIAEVESAHGRALLRVSITDRQPRGSVFAPIHWTDELASHARIDAVVGAATDPVSGQPELKHTAVAVRRFDAQWFGFAVLRQRPTVIPADYYALARSKAGWRLELAGTTWPGGADCLFRELIGHQIDATRPADVLSYSDAANSRHRFAAVEGDRLIGALYISPVPVEVSRTWAASLLETEVTPSDRMRLLAGRPGGATRDKGTLVCACYEVGANEIRDAATRLGCLSVEAIGQTLKAGTNCGSCRAEIRRILEATHLARTG
ncbi:MAG: molybdopterin-dependent oxidoreductase [Hyphomicrobiaceae bacterium]|nr:molybdopterin-dependent oxidoreductase [Hyphomicrobiaceae bacterium]